MVSFTSVVSGLLLFAGLASGHPASPIAVAVVKEQFKNALIVPSTIAAPFDNGAQLSLENVTQPGYTVQLVIRGLAEGFVTQGSPYNDTNSRYTVIAFDASYPGANQTGEYNLHYLANNLQYVALHDNRITINSTDPPRVTYSPPLPPEGSGPHRYIWLVYKQQDGFQPPADPPAGTTSVELFNYTQYISQSGLGDPFAGTYFTVERGARSSDVAVAETSAVDSMTLPQYTPSASSVAPQSTGSSSSATRSVTFDENIGLTLLAGCVSTFIGAIILL